MSAHYQQQSDKPTDTTPLVKQAVKAALVDRDIETLFARLEENQKAIIIRFDNVDKRLKALEDTQLVAKGWIGAGRFMSGIIGGLIGALIEYFARK